MPKMSKMPKRIVQNAQCACSECGHEQSTMDPCARCSSVRTVLISVLEESFGPDWRDAFVDSTIPPPQNFSGADPLALSYGMGVDSTAVLVGWWRRDIRPDWIGHAQVGNEWPETYAYRPVIDAWLAEVGFPAITDVQYVLKQGRNGHYTTLEENCLVNETLPSLAFGFKGCALKWKGEPLDAACARHFAEHVAAGGKVFRAIGYDAGPCDSKRGGVETKGPWSWIYPLREWGWDRDRCVAEIAAAGLPVPPKSSCTFCPSLKPAELIQLAKKHPDLARRAVAMEDRARPHLTKIEGLWGRGTKGTRGGEKKPGSWRVFLAEHAPEVLPPEVPPPEVLPPEVQPLEEQPPEVLP